MSSTLLHGIDISSNNAPVVLSEVATVKDFIVIKATGDESVPGMPPLQYTNPFFEEWWQQAGELGLERCMYHYARPQEQSDAITSADFFSGIASRNLKPGSCVAFDIEEGEGDLSEWCDIWLSTVEQNLGIKAWIYSNESFLKEHKLNKPRFAKHPLWLASWGPTFKVVPPWTEVIIWQNSATDTSVPGLSPRPALTDIFFGDRERFKSLGLVPIIDYEALYWTPIQKKLDAMLAVEASHVNKAFHATVSNQITLHKIARGAEPPD